MIYSSYNFIICPRYRWALCKKWWNGSALCLAEGHFHFQVNNTLLALDSKKKKKKKKGPTLAHHDMIYHMNPVLIVHIIICSYFLSFHTSINRFTSPECVWHSVSLTFPEENPNPDIVQSKAQTVTLWTKHLASFSCMLLCLPKYFPHPLNSLKCTQTYFSVYLPNLWSTI